jgi:hypothetical protein
MPGQASISRLDLGTAPGALAALNAGLSAWGHPGMMATAGEVAGALGYRIAEDNGPNGWEKWFEIGFTSPAPLAGDASRGWVDSSGRIRLWVEWTEDLLAWQTGAFIDAPGSPAAVSGGYEYWARSVLPSDSAVSTGQIAAASNAASGDARNNPFTSVIINSVVQSLAHYPYTMPGDAAQLQTDLRALGWTGATVAASSIVDWRIDIPDVDFTSYYTTNWVCWPVYYVANMYGDIVNPVSYMGFGGEFVNSAGVRTKSPRQFGRLAILPL